MIIMSVNKVELRTGEVLLDISKDTLTEDTLFEGVTGHDAQGNPVIGKFPNSEIDVQAELIEQIKSVLESKTSGGGVAKEEQEKTVDIYKNGTTEVLPDEGKTLSKVIVNTEVPDLYDEGRQEGYTEGYQASQDSIKLQEKTATENGEVVADEGYTGLSKVTVNVSGEVDTTDYLGLLVTQNLENVYSDIGGTLVPYAFYENEGVETIELPNIQYLKERCFYSCGNLTTLKLSGLIGYTYQYMASGCSKLVDVDIHNSSYISSYSFQNCTSLKKLDLHKVETIGTNAFVGATKFETLILRTDIVPELGGTSAFTNTKIKNGGTGYIYVPSALIEEYKSATNWSSFASQFRAIEDYPDICGGEV